MNRLLVVLFLSVVVSSQIMAHGDCVSSGGKAGQVLQTYIATLLPTYVVNAYSAVTSIRDVGELWTHAYSLWSSFSEKGLELSFRNIFHFIELAGHTGNIAHRFSQIESSNALLFLVGYNAYAVYAQAEDALAHSAKEGYGARLAAVFGSIDGIFHAITTVSLLYSLRYLHGLDDVTPGGPG